MTEERTRGPSAEADDLLAMLADETTRELLAALDRPMSAGELSDACDVPRSTVYRRVDRLAGTPLLDDRVVVRDDGHHTVKYDLAVTGLRVRLTDDATVEVEVDRPEGRTE